MGDKAARRFLLGAGNAVLTKWVRQYASGLAGRVTTHPDELLTQAISAVSESFEQGAVVSDLLGFYQVLVSGLTENLEAKQAAAELTGIVLLVPQQARAAALSKSAVDLIDVADDYAMGDSAKDAERSVAKVDETALVSLSKDSLDHAMVVALWSEERIRSYLLAGSIGRSPATPPPAQSTDGRTVEPPLETPEGVLRIPDVEDQPAHDLFFNWIERGGGVELIALARACVRDSGVGPRFTDLYERIASEL